MKDLVKIITGVLLLYALLTFNPLKRYAKEEIKTDTIYKTVVIPSKQNKFTKTAPKPIIIKNYITNYDNQYKKLLKEIESKYKTKADSNIILQELLQAKTKRIYKETFKDSTQTAEVIAYTTGVLDSLKFKYSTLPIKYNNVEITKYLKPNFRVLAGASTTISRDNVIIGVNAGIQTKKGNMYSVGYNTDKQITLDFKLSLFDKYKKPRN